MRLRYALSFALALALLLPLAPTAGAARGPIKGIDVSRFQGRIAWNKVGKTDLRFAYVQASRGSGRDCTVVPEECGRDQYFARNYGNAKAAGLRVGAYHRAFAKGRTRSKAKHDARGRGQPLHRRRRQGPQRRPPPRARRRGPVQAARRRQAAALDQDLGEPGREEAARQAGDLHEQLELARDRRHHLVRPERLSALGRQLRRPQAERAGRQLGGQGLDDLAVHQLGPGSRHQRERRSEPAQEGLRQARGRADEAHRRRSDLPR